MFVFGLPKCIKYTDFNAEFQRQIAMSPNPTLERCYDPLLIQPPTLKLKASSLHINRYHQPSVAVVHTSNAAACQLLMKHSHGRLESAVSGLVHNLHGQCA